MMNTLSRSLAAVLVALALAGCSAAGTQSSSDGGAATPGENEVVVTNMRFQPDSIEVEAGTKVTWLFDDGKTRHDVVGDGWGTDAQRDGAFRHTFDEPGTYVYECTLHGGMTGQVIVTDQPA